MTKIPVAASVMQDSTFYLSRIAQPELFLAKFHQALAGKKRAGKRAFDFSDVRMVYRIVDRTDQVSTIVLGRQGEQLYYNQKVYRVDKEIAQVIGEFLPERETIRSEEDRRLYKKKKYTPLECCQ